MEQFTNETNYTVWNDLTANLSNLAKILQNTGFYSSFQAFCVKLYEQIERKVGWDPKDGEGNNATIILLCTFIHVSVQSNPFNSDRVGITESVCVCI